VIQPLLPSPEKKMADGAMVDSGVATEKNECGGVEGPEAMYVKLIASDGHEFIMKRSHALTSGTIKAMLSGPGKLWSVIARVHVELTVDSSPYRPVF